MHAQSLVVTTRRLEAFVGDALAEPNVSANSTVRDRGQAMLSTLNTLGALVATSAPLPVPETPSDRRMDDAVETLVERLYDDGGLNRDDIDPTRLETTGRVRTVGGTVILPLTGDTGEVHNWQPVYRLLFERLDDIATQCERICVRFESELSGSSVDCRIWESCTEMVRETRNAVRIQLSQQERLFHMYDRSPTDPGTFAEWTIEQLTDIQTES